MLGTNEKDTIIFCVPCTKRLRIEERNAKIINFEVINIFTKVWGRIFIYVRRILVFNLVKGQYSNVIESFYKYLAMFITV